MIRRTCVVGLLALPLLNGCEDYQEKEQREARYKAERNEKEGIEKEAHKSGVDWYEVKISKYNGECQPLRHGMTPLQEIERYGVHAHYLDSAKKEGNHYLLMYDLRSAFGQRIYTTSIDWCENTIKANVK